MSDPIVASARAAVNGIREALEVGKEIESLGADIAKLGDADIAARAAYRKRQRYVHGDTTILLAVDEWRRLREIYELEETLRLEVTKKYGQAEWGKVIAIKERMAKEKKEEFDEFGRDIRKMRALKWWCFWAASFCTYLLWLGGFL